MADSLRTLLLRDFPAIEELAWKRFVSGKHFFFTRSHKQLYSSEVIFMALYLASKWARQAGANLRMDQYEKRIWNRHFEKPEKRPGI